MKLCLKIAVIAATYLAATATSSAQSLGPVLQKIKDSGGITIGHRDVSVPFSYLDNDQKPIGFSLDLCATVVDKIKQAVGLKDLKISYQLVNSSNRIPLVKNGTVDIECGTTANTIARQREVAFSVAYYWPQFMWIALKKSGVSTTDDLKGKAVVVTQGTVTSQFVAQLNQEKALGLNIIQAKDNGEAFLLVTNGRAAAFMEDDILLVGLRSRTPDPNVYVLLQDAYLSDPYGIMMSKDDPELKKLVDGVIVEQMRSGQYAKLYKKWFESPIPPNQTNLEFPQSDRVKQLVAHPSDRAKGQ